MNDQPPQKSRKLLDQIRDAIRLKHYFYNSYSTEKTYVHWARRYILFHNKRDLLKWEQQRSKPSSLT